MRVRRKKILIETRETWIIRRAVPASLRHCERCAAAAEWLTAEQSARLLGVSLRDIFRHLEAAQLHWLELVTGEIWICLPSLLADDFCPTSDLTSSLAFPSA